MPEPAELTRFLSPPQGPDELGGLGPYRILKILGVGGMGVVFEAHDPQLQRRIALKAMLPAMASVASACQRFLREAQLAAAIEHDHIIPIYKVGEDRGVPYLAMPLLEGESLKDHLDRLGKLSTEEVLRIGWEIADGLAAAHERGLIHRDIKPANIWLESSKVRNADCGLRIDKTGEPAVDALHSAVGNPQSANRVKILDFGLARAVADDTHLTLSGCIVGTPGFMAPEQGEGKADARSDLFSLGCVLYRMCTGVPAFPGTNVMSVLAKVLMDEPVPPKPLGLDVPAGLSDLIMRLLAKDPAARPQSAGQTAAALRSLSNRSGTRPNANDQAKKGALAKPLAFSRLGGSSVRDNLSSILASPIFWIGLTVLLALVLLLMRLTSPAVVIKADNITTER